MKISYIQCGDYLIPKIALETAGCLGKYGRMRLRFLKEHHPVTFNGLVLSGKLSEHLEETDRIAHERLDTLTKDMAAAENVSKELKAADPMAWVGCMNNIQARAEEIILSELVFVP